MSRLVVGGLLFILSLNLACGMISAAIPDLGKIENNRVGYLSSDVTVSSFSDEAKKDIDPGSAGSTNAFARLLDKLTIGWYKKIETAIKIMTLGGPQLLVKLFPDLDFLRVSLAAIFSEAIIIFSFNLWSGNKLKDEG